MATLEASEASLTARSSNDHRPLRLLRQESKGTGTDGHAPTDQPQRGSRWGFYRPAGRQGAAR
jgi:hypothetical protein